MEKMASDIALKVLDGGELTPEEALGLFNISDGETFNLLAIANKVREKFAGNEVDLCSIVNARSGKCSEDCAFCAQSVHYCTGVKSYPLLEVDAILEAAQKADKDGACRFCIVTSGKGANEDQDFQNILTALKRIGQETKLLRCCSLGVLSLEAAFALKEAGVSRYHHNIETAKSFFPQICTTHTYDERVQTIINIKKAGLQVCSGGIIGMGESYAQRIEMAFALKELDVDSVPLNFLNPIQGTALEKQQPLSPMEILKTIAIFRLILPGKIIRYAGGRETNLRDLQSMGMVAGINGMLIGNYLTTQGRNPEMDLQMLKDLGLVPMKNC